MTKRTPPAFSRDTAVSAFTHILRRLRESVGFIVAAAFVDMEGECIDYSASIDPYETKVNAAQMLAVVGFLLGRKEKLPFGEPQVLEIAGANRELWARRIDDEYVLVAVVGPDADTRGLRRELTRAVWEFRSEVGLTPPPWEPSSSTVRVETRPATGWQYAPSAFSQEGMRLEIADVLGRWVEPDELGLRDRICFRVRTEGGAELTLVHDPEVDQWMSRP